MAQSNKEACPKCRDMGGDTRGDNLHRYPNGGAYCFACGYLEFPTKMTFMPKESRPPPGDLISGFPAQHWDWLRQYLEPEEIITHFKYSPKLNRHVWVLDDFWQGRSVTPGVHPKVDGGGSRPFLYFQQPGCDGQTIVIVEDVVSAIKVSRVAWSVCLFGSRLTGDWMVRILKLRPKAIDVWLDFDKKMEARGYVAKFNRIAHIAATVETEKDPKEYTTEEIKEYIGI